MPLFLYSPSSRDDCALRAKPSQIVHIVDLSAFKKWHPYQRKGSNTLDQMKLGHVWFFADSNAGG